MMTSVNPLCLCLEQLLLSLNQNIPLSIKISQLILPFPHILTRIPVFKKLPLQHSAIVAHSGDTLA